MPFLVQVRESSWCKVLVRLATLFLVVSITAADPREYAVELSVEVLTGPVALQLKWPASTIARQYVIKRRTLGGGNWGSARATLPGSATGYTDDSVTDGAPYEYEVQMETTIPANGGGWVSAYGYVYAGANVPAADYKGKALLIVDSSVGPALANDLATFESDLIGSGWAVVRREVSRSGSPQEVKSLVRAEHTADPFNLRSVVLIGHVPVPYSGNIAPDLHESHRGAWPADGYYGELNGTWTDSTVNVRSFDSEDNDNIPGDGKFDQSQFPSVVALEVGRIDFWNMPAFSGRSEVDLLRSYFRKNHAFRHRVFTAPRRGLIRDNFGDLDGDAPAVDAWRHYSQFFGPGNVREVGFNQFFPTLDSEAYLWAYACGGGGYLKADGVGTTHDFAQSDPKAVFLILHGSYFGDWNNNDNFLRAAVASPNYTLASIWSGLPHWYMHPMGLGATIGVCTRLSQNNVADYKSHQNISANQVHISLIGDPTLEMFTVAPPSNLSGSPGASVTLNWAGSPDENIVGYHVYYSTSASVPFQKLTGAPLNVTSYSHNITAGTYRYMVRALKLERTGSGTFYNMSQGIFTTVTQGDGGGEVPAVSITSADDDASETGSNRGEFRFTRSFAADSPLTVEYLVGGTAENGVDYAALPGSVTISAGNTETILAIVPLADSLSEGEETVTVQIRPNANYSVGTPSAGFLRIEDAPAQMNLPPTISAISAQKMPANETLTVEFQIGDADTALADLNVRGLSSDTQLIPATGLTFGGSGPDRSLQIEPAEDATGSATITVLVSDGNSEVAVEFELTVEAPNLPPAAIAQSIMTPRETPLVVTLTGTDPEGEPLTFAISSQPTKGAITGNPPVITYTPTASASGRDTFSFTVYDGLTVSEPATVSIEILATNRTPTAISQSVVTLEDTPWPITVEGVDPDGDPLTYEVVIGPTRGILSGRNNQYQYSPGTNFFGADTFTFRVSDGEVDSAPATISINVSPVNDIPTVSSGTVQLIEDQTSPITLVAKDPDGEKVAYEVLTIPLKGHLSGTPPNLTYTPNANATGADSLTFRVKDATSESTVAAVNITILPANDPPVAVSQSISTGEDVPIIVPIGGNDPDGDALTFRVVTGPAMGKLSGAPPNLLYTPTANTNGHDSFTFVVSDGAVDSAIATVSINIEPANDPPVMSAVAAQFARKGATIGPLTVQVHDPDHAAGELMITSASSHSNIVVPADIEVEGTGTNRTVTITSVPGATGTTIITLRVSDGQAHAESSFLLTMTNTPPSAVPDDLTVFAGPSRILVAELLANDTDGDGDLLQIVEVSESEQGRPVQLTNDTIIYSGELGLVSDSFEYTIQDSSGATAIARVTIAFSAPPKIAAIQMISGAVTLRVSGAPNSRFRVEKSIDARTWTVAGETETGPDGNGEFTDPAGPDSHKFYRIEWP